VKDGFAVIEALRSIAQERAAIVAWASHREVREYAAYRFRGEHVRVLGGAFVPEVFRRAIESALRIQPVAPSERVAPPAAGDVRDVMADLLARARELCGTAGAAVYVRVPGETQFRTAVAWESDAPIPHSPDDLPAVYGWILETGEALVLPDLSNQPIADVRVLKLRDSLRGLLAVPIVGPDDQIAGALCVFDVKPFTFGTAEVDALKSLGRGARVSGETGPTSAETGERPSGRAEPSGSSAKTATESPRRPSPTVVLDRGTGDLAIARELARVRREERRLSVILFEVNPVIRPIDDLVDGAPLDVLAAVADTLAGSMRGSDLAVRWGIKQLLVVLPGLGTMEAKPVAERVRAALQAGSKSQVTVSGGVTEFLADDTQESILARAAEQARLARTRGDNHVA
jgi:diguanylate cyclase (GGDEF)-like protein